MTINAKNLFVVGITGGRDFRDFQLVGATLDRLHAARPIDVIVHGGCDGADRLADDWALMRNVQPCELRVTRTMWKALGGYAGPRRNGLMLAATRPALLVAFPGGKGTKDCVSQAMGLGIRVLAVSSGFWEKLSEASAAMKAILKT